MTVQERQIIMEVDMSTGVALMGVFIFVVLPLLGWWCFRSGD